MNSARIGLKPSFNLIRGESKVTQRRDTPGDWPLHQALQAARDILDRKLDVIDGSRKLAEYAHEIVPDWSADPDFVVFGAVASETDDLPIGEARRYWSAAALAEGDAKLEQYSGAVENVVRAACASVIARFTVATTYP